MNEFRHVTEDSIKAKIRDVSYMIPPGSTTTICTITLQNGFSVIGTSACVDPAMFNKQTGQLYAYEEAFNKLWPLEGYLLKEEMHQQALRGGEYE